MKEKHNSTTVRIHLSSSNSSVSRSQETHCSRAQEPTQYTHLTRVFEMGVCYGSSAMKLSKVGCSYPTLRAELLQLSTAATELRYSPSFCGTPSLFPEQEYGTYTETERSSPRGAKCFRHGQCLDFISGRDNSFTA